MTARSPSAFFLSTSLHGLVVAVVVLLTYLAQVQVKEVPKVMELVAGDGDNYGATAAPALGTPNGVKIAIPEPAAPAPVKLAPPAPVAEPAPITKAPVEKAPVEKPVTHAPPKPVEKTPDFSKQIKRTIIRKESQAKREIKKEREAEQKRLTKEEFDRENKARKIAAAGGNPKVKHIDAEGIAGGVVGGSTSNKTGGAGDKALTRDEGDLLDAYFSIVKQRLREGLDKPPGLSDALSAIAEFQLNADGTISNAHISRSSGSDEFDRAVMEDIRHFTRVVPPREWKGGPVNLTFRMKEEDE